MVVRQIAIAGKGLFKRPSTILFPEEKEQQPDGYRGLPRLDMATCVSCFACELICPNKCIVMVDAETDRGTKKMPEIHIDRCLFCALCEEVCPTECLTLSKDQDFERFDRREFIMRPQDQE